jgi:hypothetical protein
MGLSWNWFNEKSWDTDPLNFVGEVKKNVDIEHFFMYTRMYLALLSQNGWFTCFTPGTYALNVEDYFVTKSTKY